ncbi:MAG: carboxypeptidase regulatory-like domain-containing protein [Acidobacteriota bacterium]
MKSRTTFLLLILFIPSLTVAQNPNNMIRGKVRSTNGTPVNHAIVELHDNSGAIISQTVTRNDGDFAFSRIVPSEYEVVVTVSGYDSSAQRVVFTQPDRSNFFEVVTIEVILKPRTDTTLPVIGTRFVQEVPKPARAAFEKAMEQLRDNKAQEAIALLREAVNNFNDYFDANFMLARELFRAGEDQAALEAIERARRVNEREGGVYHLFGLIMLRQRKFVVAEFAFREASNLKPNQPLFHFFRARALIEIAIYTKDEKEKIEDLALAEKELNQAWDLSEKKLNEVYLQRARIFLRRNDKAAAIKEFEAFLKAEPNAANAATVRQAIDNLRANK